MALISDNAEDHKDDEDLADAKPPKITIPDDFKSEEEFLEHVRKTVRNDLEFDKTNREEALEDGRFFVGDQWDESAKQRRIDAKKPVLTINRLPAFVAQITGNRRLNETLAKVVPDQGGTKFAAAVRQGIIRNIQKNSIAEIAYNVAHLGQVISGIGNFRLDVRPAEKDVFNMDIVIEQIPNSFAVVWDRAGIEPTGNDAGHCTIFDRVAEDDFKAKYPWATPGDIMNDIDSYGDMRVDGWFNVGEVRIAAFWRVRARPATYIMDLQGKVKDVTGIPQEQWIKTVAQYPDGTPIIRDAKRKYAELYILCGTALLEGPYELPISRVPIYRVPGWEFNVGETRHRWGLVRFMKDPQRLHNYWRSVVAEKLMQSPRAVWTARHNAVQGREDEWRNSHKSDDALLVFNDDAAEAPTRTVPAQMEPALIQEAGQSTQDLKDVSNLHEASLGQTSNEVSGKAIIARQRVGELGSILYQDNLNLAIEACGRTCDELIPFTHDQPRIVKIIGDDDKELLQAINQDPDTDITGGKYSFSITTGASYVTKRIEAAEGMLNFINAVPQVAATIAPEIVEAQDWPNSAKIANKLRSAQPAELTAPEDMTQQQQAQAQAQAQATNQAAQMAQEMAQANLDEAKAKAGEISARTKLLLAQAVKAHNDTLIKAASEDTKSRSTQLHDHLDVISVAHEGEGENDNSGD